MNTPLEAPFSNAATNEALQKLLQACLDARSALISQGNQSALRLFNGFYEGLPGFVVDLFAGRWFFNHAREPRAWVRIQTATAFTSSFRGYRACWSATRVAGTAAFNAESVWGGARQPEICEDGCGTR